MTFKIETLIIGLSPYSTELNDYGPLYKDNVNLEYPFDNIAFIPCKKSERSLYEVKSYRRLMGFLSGKALNREDFKKYEDIKGVIQSLMKEGIYLVNHSEIEADNIDLSKNNLLTNNAHIILFGSDVIDYYAGKDDLKNNYKIICAPHPSPLNNDIFWKAFDKEYSKRDYTSIDFIKQRKYFSLK